MEEEYVMFRPVKVLDIELSHPPEDIEGLDGFVTLKGLIRLHGTPIGYAETPVVNGRCAAAAIRKAALDQHNWPIMRHLLCDLLAAPPRLGGWSIADLLDVSHPVCNEPWPSVTAAVCTRDRPADLAVCLDSLNRLDYPNLDILVVDNAPSSDATEHLVRTTYPCVRYIREPRPGLNWARNRAIIEACGDIVAFTDDDAVVDPGWVRALASVFAENPGVMAVTGLVVPHELETAAQLYFEWCGGFGRGFKRRWWRVDRETGKRQRYHGTGQCGTGANMAYRRSLFDQIGYFDPALDVGTVTNGGGDLEMFFRVLKEGHTLVYEPNAIVRHRHRRDYAQLRTQITNSGIGLYSYFVRSALAYPDERAAFVRFGLWWLWRGNIRRLLISLVRPARLPRDLILAKLRGSLIGLGRYQKARRAAAQIANSFRPLSQADVHKKRDLSRGSPPQHSNPIGVRTVDLNQPLSALNDVTDYTSVRVFVIWNDRLLGSVDIANHRQPVSATHLRDVVVDHFHLKLLKPDDNLSTNSLWAEAMVALTRHYLAAEDVAERAKPTRLPADVPVSVVVATLDRPDDLRECLRCLTAQESSRQVEIVVVDNNPSSGLTPPVVTEFPEVVLVVEPRQGLAYARNAGFIASMGDIVITTDDDVILPPDWLEKLIAPFVRPDVMVVTGNTLPLELETTAQRLFERYGGLGRGFEPFEVGGNWFESFRRRAVPTWKLGATANAAFRASMFSHPSIGLMDEALGPGMPAGVGEDTYLFYKVLKAGDTLVYEPTAYVWHKHRRSLPALRRQIYNYSKGHVAYHLTTLLCDHDLRALPYLTLQIPRWRIKQILRQIRGRLGGRRSDYPLSLVLLEIVGNMAGPWALWRSRRRVKREGRSGPYKAVSRHSARAGQVPLAETPQCAAVDVSWTAFNRT
jgi:GT2 family glycosyltransferase